MSRFERWCAALASVLTGTAVVALVVIVVAMAAQVVFRYVLRAPLSHSDEVAQTALTWLTFLGAAALYRSRGHIEVDVLVARLPSRPAAATAALVELAIGVSLVAIVAQVVQTRDVMLRVTHGTLGLSKFTSQFLPLLIGAAATVVFVVESILRRARAVPLDRISHRG